ncbi:hypothetical protein DJ030_07815 [bacterium endosymbiont of Escarpia laminata]|nr:MAG: hypothetical protein DJ031_08005 [bacterium endosymbiont of Escarpia laminata]RLJ19924.1 MAG: hypothetical protein DJ030_07815 [bacterium endosymbiont of Escarpia laminata]
MAGMLALKQLHPLPDEKRLSESFDLKLDRDQQCPKQSEFAGFSANYPLWGMPYGLPGLANDEYRTLLNWLAQGAGPGQRRPLSNQIQQRISAWEDFLNGDSLKHQLMSRYLYEHLFVANLYFKDLDRRVFFKLVRSATPPGGPIERIVTRRPYDDPGVDRVYYRLTRVKTTILTQGGEPLLHPDPQQCSHQHHPHVQRGEGATAGRGYPDGSAGVHRSLSQQFSQDQPRGTATLHRPG